MSDTDSRTEKTVIYEVLFLVSQLDTDHIHLQNVPNNPKESKGFPFQKGYAQNAQMPKIYKSKSTENF